MRALTKNIRRNGNLNVILAASAAIPSNTSVSMRRLALWPALLFAVALAAWSGPAMAAKAGAAQSFILAASDGYGVQDCLAEGGECGQAMADAWCQSQGHSRALSFGPSDDVTGAISKSTAAKIETGAYVITCGD